MLTQCKACAAVNVLDVERAATGKARCMICRKRLGLPEDHASPDRSSFRATANVQVAIVDPTKGISEEMETELTPLMPIDKVKELADLTVPGAALLWNDMTDPEPLRLPLDTERSQSFDVEMTDEVDPRDIIDTDDAGAEHALFTESTELEQADEQDSPRESVREIAPPAGEFREDTKPFELSRPSEKSRISENLPMVFDCQDQTAVSTVPSIPAAKRQKMSLFAASLVIFALGAADLVSTRTVEKRMAAAAAAQHSNVALVEVAAAPPAPLQEAPAVDTPTIAVEDLPVVVAAPSAPSRHTRPAQLKQTESESLTHAGDRAMKRNDFTTARASYALALATNPSYFPARLGAADVVWASGDHTSARAAYLALSENFPTDMLPARVFERKVASR